jgi:type II secretory pathway component PulM
MSFQKMNASKDNFTLSNRFQNGIQPFRKLFSELSPREKLFVLLALYLIVFAFIWLVLVSPAMQILKNSSSKNIALDKEIQVIQKLAQEAKTLRSEPKEIPSNFEASLKSLSENIIPGKATTASSAEKITVNLNAVSAQNLARWLEALRIELHHKPIETQLQFQQGNWTGVVVFKNSNQ